MAKTIFCLLSGGQCCW